MGGAASVAKSAVKSTKSTSKSGVERPPMWIYTAQVTGDTSQDIFGGLSPGYQMLGPNTVVRQRVGHHDSDGVMWKKGFTEGKHVFEIVYPMKHRGLHASVGVATNEAPITQHGQMPLVGSNNFSWGICLRTKRAYHRKSAINKYPSTLATLPDKFYMYLDIDSGCVSFGSDLDYYGTAITTLRKDKPLHPMVCSCMKGATITMVYRGQGDPNRIPNLAMTPAGPPMQDPEPRKEPPPMDAGPSNKPPPYTEKDPGKDGSESKMADDGPPPPPPTKMGDKGNDTNGSNLSLKKEVEPIQEESTTQ